MKIKHAILILAMVLGNNLFGQDRDLNKIQEEFLSWKFGMFIHFNMSTFVPGGWSTGDEDPLLFNPEDLDVNQWAEAAVAAKMKYAVLTVKHTGGFCLWDSEFTDHDVTMFKNYKNGKGDLVREFVDAFRAKGIKVGLYYCFPLFHPNWADYKTLPIEGYEKGTADVVGFMTNQFTELLTNYGDIDLIWVDQPQSTKAGLKPGDWLSIKNTIHSLQPNCIVIGNNAVDYSSSDVVCYEFPYSLSLPNEDNTAVSEVCDRIQNGWFANLSVDAPPVRDLDYVLNMLTSLNKSNSNYLLNCAPNYTGKITKPVVNLLKEIGENWDPNTDYSDQKSYPWRKRIINEIPNPDKKLAVTFDGDLDPVFAKKAIGLFNEYDMQATFYINETALKENLKTLKLLNSNNFELASCGASGISLEFLKKRELKKEITIFAKNFKSISKNLKPKTYRSLVGYNDTVYDALHYLEIPSIGYSSIIDGNFSDSALKETIKSGAILKVEQNELGLSQLEYLLKAAKKRGYTFTTVASLIQDYTNLKTGNDVYSGAQ